MVGPTLQYTDRRIINVGRLEFEGFKVGGSTHDSFGVKIGDHKIAIKINSDKTCIYVRSTARRRCQHYPTPPSLIGRTF